MGNKSSLLLRPEEIAQIHDETGCKDNILYVVCVLYCFGLCSCFFGICPCILITFTCTNQHSNFLNVLIWVSVTPNQIERLYSRFTSLDRTDCGTLSREDFLRIPELAINPLCDRIVHAFFADSTDDRVNFRQFMQVLAHFRPIKTNSTNKLNSREEKLKC